VRVLLGITNPQEELECKAENHNDVSVSYSFSQKYRGIPVYGTSITVSADSDTGEVQALNSSYIPNHKLESMNLTPEISLDEIKSKFGDIKTCELNIYAIKDHTENPILVYVMTTTDEVIIADANNGNEVLRFQSTTDWKSASTTGFGQTEKGENVTFPIQFKWFGFYPYYQKDIERQIEIKGDKSGSLAHDFNTIWLDKTANSAYTNIIKVYDWYKIYKYQVESGMFSHIKMVF
jgi:Zn-dependent metalloprotease